MHIAMSSVIQLDNFIHPMVLFVNYLNCISINSYLYTYKMKESHIKTINLGRGEGEVVIRPSLHPRIFSHVCRLVKWGRLNNKNIVIKINPFGIDEITIISMATYHANQNNGGVWGF